MADPKIHWCAFEPHHGPFPSWPALLRHYRSAHVTRQPLSGEEITWPYDTPTDEFLAALESMFDDGS